MRSPALMLVALTAALSVASLVTAEEVTLEGTIVCAKCILKKPDAKECQNVLLVPGADGKDVEYYLAKSEAADKIGEVCMSKHKVRATGAVAEKDGRKWLTASSLTKLES